LLQVGLDGGEKRGNRDAGEDECDRRPSGPDRVADRVRSDDAAEAADPGGES